MGIGDAFRRLAQVFESDAKVFDAGADTVAGTRTAMREAYQNSQSVKGRGEVPIAEEDLPNGVVGTPEHLYALWEMLASRYWSAGVSRDEIQRRSDSIWAEISPFLYLDQQVAVEALTEYVVWKEGLEDFPWTADEARVDFLREKVREGVERAEWADPSGWAGAAREKAKNLDEGESVWIRWVELL
jgi:hypothetical protein